MIHAEWKIVAKALAKNSWHMLTHVDTKDLNSLQAVRVCRLRIDLSHAAPKKHLGSPSDEDIIVWGPQMGHVLMAMKKGNTM